jgi:hypothetical protein
MHESRGRPIPDGGTPDGVRRGWGSAPHPLLLCQGRGLVLARRPPHGRHRGHPPTRARTNDRGLDLARGNDLRSAAGVWGLPARGRDFVEIRGRLLDRYRRERSAQRTLSGITRSSSACIARQEPVCLNRRRHGARGSPIRSRGGAIAANRRTRRVEVAGLHISLRLRRGRHPQPPRPRGSCRVEFHPALTSAARSRGQALSRA